MYTVSEEEFELIKPRNGIIIVEVGAVRNAKTESGILLTAATDYTMAQTAIKQGVVAKVSDESELMVGDMLHFDYMIGMNIQLKEKGLATSNDNLMLVGDKKYFLVPMSQSYYYVRNGEKKALNHFLIASKVDGDMFTCEIVSDRDYGLQIPKIGQRFLYNGTAAPTEPNYLAKEVLYRVSPKNIYAIEE